jgi:hypothetical protein
MWIWFGILFLISIISFIYSFYIYVPFFARYRFIHKLIGFIKSKKDHTFSPSIPISQYPITTTTAAINNGNDDPDFKNVNRQKNFVQWLQRDGVFLLHLLNSHSGEPLTIKCLENLIEIWINNYEQKSELARRLLKNEFQFSK